MKMKSILVSMLAVATLASCSKDDNTGGTPDAGKTNVVRVSIGGSGAKSRADGGTEAGKGSEQDIKDGWVVLALDATSDKYKAVTSTENGGGAMDGDGRNDIAVISNVKVGSKLYVLTNVIAANMNSDITTWVQLIAGNIEVAQITALIEKQVKSNINVFSEALQANQTNPNFNGEAMLMTGEATVPAPTAVGVMDLNVSVAREFAKVNLTVAHSAGGDFVTLGGVTINNVTEAYPRRVVTQISPFDLAKGDNWYVPAPFVKDEGANNNTWTNGASEFRYVYNVNNWDNGVAPGTVHFYVTPNYCVAKSAATAVIVKANITADFGDGRGQTTEDRFFRALIADADVAATPFQTWKNNIYNITATINSLGHATEDDALDSDKVDLKVQVTIADWLVRNVTTDFE